MSKFKKFNLLYKLFCLVLGIFILIFNNFCLEYLPIFICAVIALYIINTIINFIILKEVDKFELVYAIIEFAFCISIIILKEYFNVVCILWSSWIILRELIEIYEEIKELKTDYIKIIDMVESFVLLYFAISLIINTNEHHAHVHVIITSIEFIFNMGLFLLHQINKKEK